MIPSVLRLSIAAAAVCTVAQLAAGCGSSSASLRAGDAARLHKDVAGIRSAAAAHNPDAAHRAVRTFEADVGRLRAAGRLAPADAGALLSDASRVNGRVSLEIHAQTPAPRPATTPPAQSSGPAESPGPAGQGNGRGKGHGKHGGRRSDGGDGGGGGDGGD
jgi:hypothetical protein